MENVKNTNENKLLTSVDKIIDYVKKNMKLPEKNTDCLNSNDPKNIRDTIANLDKKNFNGDEDAANKFKLSCCRLFSDANDRRIIFDKIGDGSDADLILTFKKLELEEQQCKDFFLYLPDDLQITEVFKYAVCDDEEEVRDFEKKMLEKLDFQTWQKQAWVLFFVLSHILLLPTGISELILWFSSDYRESLKTKIVNDIISELVESNKNANDKNKKKFYNSNEGKKEIKRKLIYQFVASSIKSILAIIGFVLLVHELVILPFSVFLSCCWLALISQPTLMALIFIPNFKRIKNLCIGIKNAVIHNRQIQKTLNERRNKWQETTQKIEKKQQQESSLQETVSFDDKLTQSEGIGRTGSQQNLISTGIDSEEDNRG